MKKSQKLHTDIKNMSKKSENYSKRDEVHSIFNAFTIVFALEM